MWLLGRQYETIWWFYGCHFQYIACDLWTCISMWLVEKQCEAVWWLWQLFSVCYCILQMIFGRASRRHSLVANDLTEFYYFSAKLYHLKLFCGCRIIEIALRCIPVKLWVSWFVFTSDYEMLDVHTWSSEGLYRSINLISEILFVSHHSPNLLQIACYSNIYE